MPLASTLTGAYRDCLFLASEAQQPEIQQEGCQMYIIPLCSALSYHPVTCGEYVG